MPELIAGGLRIHFVDAPVQPRRPAIVFLHGAGANHTVWLAQMKALRDRAWVVIPDLPGHGRSEPLPGLTIAEYATAMVPFLEALLARLDGAAESPRGETGAGLYLAGHSMGGAIALTIARERPDLIAGLVLVGSGAKLAVSSQILDGLQNSPRETQALLARWSFTPNADPGLIIRSMRDLAGTSIERVLADFRACNAFDLRSEIPRIAAPTLIVCGTEDRMTPPAYAEWLARTLPHGQLRLVPNTGHAIMVETPDAVSSAIAEFLPETAPHDRPQAG